METGEIFGELSLILDENRKASVKAISPSEIIEINKTALEAILLSSNIELHKMIQQMSKELGKSSDYRLPITKKDLVELVKDSPDVIRALSLQLHYRLSQRDFSMKKINFGETTKLLLTEEETLFNQGDEGNKAYMIISGRLTVFVDNVRVGSMSDGEVFGELALMLNQKKKCNNYISYRN